MKKIIIVEGCIQCPLVRSCKTFKNAAARSITFAMKTMVVLGKTILNNCPLETLVEDK
ncbi:hypothetical protein LCGC14_1976560 [marine sediment metagenome]|uniref:Uncharacterized protein n=1 Tax=marine sediment metagenome TaxID=412755 RepID=A0A0F9FA89_9ZZZZ